ncbi:conjugal transfer protein TraD [Pedobacter alluvionis]|uniref:Conjugal transfer protein TraD n=1 Tax=Pedobacter alluvionis TaxID=475253 RepID=A0A497XYA3_9SPHI|nr:conjugal transfer protein TraD [Pedobacter alluvionis]RLJ75101.1 hypothetical protein BCL90_3448 [Pedobacter alluvionis]TFB30206.1 conjugal transfer protein TraD [Pedobacter alluvionis]
METVIVICLLVVIALLLHDKISINSQATKVEKESKTDSILPDIIGHSKRQQRQIVPNTASKSQKESLVEEGNNFDEEIKEKDFKRQIPQEELDEIFSTATVDLEEEEEEWNRYEFADGDAGFAQGVTFEELGTVGMILRQEVGEPSMQIKAADIVHKIQGTELFALLENSTENASRQIAELLDSRLSLGVDSGSSTLRNNLDDFDIGEFI